MFSNSSKKIVGNFLVFFVYLNKMQKSPRIERQWLRKVNAPPRYFHCNNSKNEMFLSFRHTIQRSVVEIELCISLRIPTIFYLQNNGYRCQRYNRNLFHLWAQKILYPTQQQQHHQRFLFLYLLFFAFFHFFVFTFLLLFVFSFSPISLLNTGGASTNLPTAVRRINFFFALCSSLGSKAGEKKLLRELHMTVRIVSTENKNEIKRLKWRTLTTHTRRSEKCGVALLYSLLRFILLINSKYFSSYKKCLFYFQKLQR